MKQKNIKDIGTYVSKEYFQKLSNAYQEAYPSITSSFVISKDLLHQLLNISDQVVGIRFMYGLADTLNPNSLRLLVIPCGGTDDIDANSHPLILEQGYYDHLENCYSVLETAELIHNFVQSMKASNQDLTYKTIRRGAFFGKNQLLDLVKHKACAHLKIHFGLIDQMVEPVLEPLDASFNASFNIYMEFAKPCPTFCGETSPECLATMAVRQFSLETELDTYRVFRDQELLHIRGGGIYYELYYFISPFIGHFISKQTNKAEVLKLIYEEKMLPFSALLSEKRYEEALGLLSDTLTEWTDTYQLKLA